MHWSYNYCWLWLHSDPRVINNLNLRNKMSERTVVVVFPSLFSLNKISSLVTSIRTVLNAKNQSFNKIRKNDSVIIVDAKDPVFASSAIASLFGIEKIAIATEVENSFNSVVTAIVKVGSNLILTGERFYVKVEGQSTEYLPKDVELAATSALIEKTSDHQIKPGTESMHDKLIYTYLTKSYAYVCIFMDKAAGGIPPKCQDKTILCCIYDELSAVSCLQTIKMGFDVRILVCYRNESELLNIVKMINQILPLLGQIKVKMNFCKLELKQSGSSNLLFKITAITEILSLVAAKAKIDNVSIAISPLIFPASFIEYNASRLFQRGIFPWFPLCNADNSIFESAKEIGLGKYIPKIENLCRLRFNDKNIAKGRLYGVSQKALRTLKTVTITLGPKNIHEIIDSLKSNH